MDFANVRLKMCLSVIGLHVSTDYPFIMIHNRDEYYSRKFDQAEKQTENPILIGGRDHTSQGMWLGVSSEGRFGAVTNYRDPKQLKTDVRSRGELIPKYLKTKLPLDEYLNILKETRHHYNGYNLILGPLMKPVVYSSITNVAIPLTPGVHGLSNHVLNTPWPKLVRAKSRFSQAIQSSSHEALTSSLFEILSDSKLADPEELPQTGIPPELEHLLSSVFIKTEVYGTVCSAVITLNRSGELQFLERYFGKEGMRSQVTHRLNLENSQDLY